MTEQITNKRNPTDGFDLATMPSRLEKMRKYSAQWRRVEQRKIVVTTLEQSFRHTPSDKTVVVHHLCPWGMREAFTSLLTKDKCKNLECTSSFIAPGVTKNNFQR